MSKYYIWTMYGYIETNKPFHHDHFVYNAEEDAYYEELPHYDDEEDVKRK